jgi:hypothetical protein
MSVMTLPRPAHARVQHFHAMGADRSAVTLALMRAAYDQPTTLQLERWDWFDALSDGELPFEAPELLPLLHRALRTERLDLLAPTVARSDHQAPV